MPTQGTPEIYQSTGWFSIRKRIQVTTSFMLSLTYFLLPAYAHAASGTFAWEDPNASSLISGYFFYHWEDGKKNKQRAEVDLPASCPSGESPKTKCFTLDGHDP